MPKSTHDLPPWWYVGLPVLSLAGYMGAQLPLYHLRERPHGMTILQGELGLLEFAQVAVLGVAIWFAARLLRARTAVPARWMRRWIWALLLACVYILGEEMSWGQHYLGWETPGWLKAINAQDETNLHNIHSGWLIFKPRAVSELAILLGGIGYPLWRAYGPSRGRRDRAPASWAWPTEVGLPAAVLMALMSVFRKLDIALELELPLFTGIDYGEMREYFIYVFVLLYLWSLSRRLARVARPDLAAEGLPSAAPEPAPPPEAVVQAR